jgi:predicted esterase
MTDPIAPAAAQRLLRAHALRQAGAPLAVAPAAVLMVHGRGATAESILALADAFGLPDLAWLAPQAPGHSWYPLSFLAPRAANQPALDNALGQIDAVVRDLVAAGLPQERLALLGFSQGACLALDYAARRGGRFGAVIGLSGGLIGPDLAGRQDAPLDGTPVFLGCSERDPHIPAERVAATAVRLAELGASVTERLYPGATHSVNEDEIGHARRLLAPLARSAG